LLGTEIYWPWYTLIGLIITVTVAWLVNAALPDKPASQDKLSETIPRGEKDSI
jgi:hypothetical protein